MKLLTPQELSNESYQAMEEISGSDLNTVFQKSLAHWKYSESKSSKALEFGIVSHAMILEPERFDDEFVKALDLAEYPDAMVTTKDLQAWLKDRGQKVSGTKPEITERIIGIAKMTLEQVFIWDLMVVEHSESNADKTIVPIADYEKVQLMRDCITSNKAMADMLKNGIAEHSIVGKLATCKVANKVRPDLITAGGHLVNYKTARDIHPEKFGKHCYDLGYLLKASLEWDMFTELYGEEPKAYIFLAQEKEAPYVWKPYYITPEQLRIGRAQREYAQSLIENAIETGKYSAYGHEPAPLELPTFITKKYEE
jgi:hypothetical protein